MWWLAVGDDDGSVHLLKSTQPVESLIDNAGSQELPRLTWQVWKIQLLILKEFFSVIM